MTERFGAKDPKSTMLRFHTQTGGATLTAQQPENNIVRTALEALAAVLGGTQSLHTNSLRRGPGAARPSTAAKIALRTQQIIGYETGVTDTSPTRWRLVLRGVADRRARAAGHRATSRRSTAMGGAVAAIEAGLLPGRDPRGGVPRSSEAIEAGDRAWWSA